MRQVKPYNISAAISPRIARACVNLVCKPGESMVDPCCGSGTIPMEAAALGIRAYAFDRSTRMVYGARRNARHFGLDVLIGMGDVCILAGRFDAVVTNFPYGTYISHKTGFAEAAIGNLRNLAKKAAVVTNRDFSDLFAAANYQMDGLVTLPKGKLSRYIHVVSAL